MAATRARWFLVWFLLPVAACDETSGGVPGPDESDVEAACQRMCERQDECGQLAASTVESCTEACEANLTEDCVQSRWESTIDARDACGAGTCEALGDCLAAAQCVGHRLFLDRRGFGDALLGKLADKAGRQSQGFVSHLNVSVFGRRPQARPN